MAIPEGFGVATMHWSQTNGMSDITVTCGFDASATATPNDVAEAIESYFIAGTGPCVPTRMTVGWTFVGVSVLIQDPGGLIAGQSYTVTVGTAVDAAPPVPAYSPYIVTKYTTFSGVRYRGRMYPPFTLSDSENIAPDGSIEAVNLGVLRDAWSDTFDLWAGFAYPPVLIHQPTLAVPSPPVPTPITSFFVQPVVGIQRRRKSR